MKKNYEEGRRMKKEKRINKKIQSVTSQFGTILVSITQKILIFLKKTCHEMFLRTS